MAAGDKYLKTTNFQISNKQLIRALINEDANGNPVINIVGGAFTPPPPPFLLTATAFASFSSITLASYQDGNTPTESFVFGRFAAGLTPPTGKLTLTPSANLQLNNGTTYQSTPLTLASDYAGGAYADTQPFFLKVRLNPSSPIGTYNETLTLSSTTAGNVSSWVVNVSGSVVANTQYVVATGGIITRHGDYLRHTIPISDMFIVTQLGGGLNNVGKRVVVGAGGGGGGSADSYGGSGGGANGDIIEDLSYNFALGSFPVIVGLGGLKGNRGVNQNGFKGGDSSFDGITAEGGVEGAGVALSGNANGKNGKSGSGAGYGNFLQSSLGGLGILGQGFKGGDNLGGSLGYTGAGGGGKLGAGQDSKGLGNIGALGGLGKTCSINGEVYSEGGLGPGNTYDFSLVPKKGSGGHGDYGPSILLPIRNTNGGDGEVVIEYYSPL